jgi:ABC-type transporter Mla maintaining outer membrane lipid asymmetry ATPase subunit MlaF
MTITPTQPAIRATGLRKSFGGQLVLDGIDLEVAEGTVFARVSSIAGVGPSALRRGVVAGAWAISEA